MVRRGDALVETGWDEAIQAVARGLGETLESAGAEAVGVLGSARCTNEDNYVLVRFARAILGTGNLDCSLARLCSTMPWENGAGPGPWVSTGQLSDLEESDLTILVGSDPAEEHPAAAARLHRARQRGARLVTMSTRRHALARLADLHLPVEPGAEPRLIGAVLRVLLSEEEKEGDREGDLAALYESVADMSPEALQQETGVPADSIRQVAQLFSQAQRVAIAHASGLALSPGAIEGLRVLSDLAAVGASKAGPHVVLISLLARNNLQGCQDMGVAPDFLPGYVPMGDDEGVKKFEGAWGCTLGRRRGLSTWQMLENVQAMYVMGDDPVAHAPSPDAAAGAISRLNCLVVQDVFMSATAALADVVLPAAAFAERAGTWTNLERRVQRISPAAEAPGEARDDWRIVADISRAMGRPLPYRGEKAILEEIADLLPLYGGALPTTIGPEGGRGWPIAAVQEAAAAPVGRGAAELRARPMNAEAPPPKTNGQRPVLLVADPTLRPWDGEPTVCNTLAAAAEFTTARKDYPDGMLLLSPGDADRSGLREGQVARIASGFGEATARVLVTDEVSAGVAVMPYDQAAASGLLEVLSDAETGRRVLAPTAVSVSSAQ
jgi:predicted molibdopterin-dependent oxidoreductase YjgC